MPSFFSVFKSILVAVSNILGYKIWLGDFVFSLGSVFLGTVLLSASALLLGFLFKRD